MGFRMSNDRPSPYLQARYYSDLEIFEEERRALFTDTWISIGAGAQLAQPGDVCPVTVAGQQLVLTRDRDGCIHVFHNVCRHRGTQLVNATGSRRGGLIICPYHHWAYTLDGALKSAPYWDRSAGFVPDETTKWTLGLCPVRFAVWFDVIFVNPSGTAAPFEEFIAPLARHWNVFDPSELRLAVLKEYRVPANWKLICENFLDGYHVPLVHHHLGFPKAAPANIETIALSDDIFGAFVPRGETDKPPIPDVLPAFPGLPAALLGSRQFICVYPNTLLAITPNWYEIISVHPESAASSKETLALYLVGDESQQPRLAVQRANFCADMLKVNDQDVEILALQQAGRTSTASDQGTFAPYWDEIVAMFHRRAQLTVSAERQ